MVTGDERVIVDAQVDDDSNISIKEPQAGSSSTSILYDDVADYCNSNNNCSSEELPESENAHVEENSKVVNGNCIIIYY